MNNDRSSKILKKFGFQETGQGFKYSLSRKEDVEHIELELIFSAQYLPWLVVE